MNNNYLLQLLFLNNLFTLFTQSVVDVIKIFGKKACIKALIPANINILE